MNLHGTVRGAITSINPDITAQYYASAGATTNADFTQTPTYATAVSVRCQVQPLSRDDLRLVEKLNMQGVFRSIFMFGNPQGIVRIQAKNGDILQFSPFRGEASQTWKIANVDGPWNVEQGGWTKLIVCLQTNGP
jgi:hypothetical protein